MSDEPDTSAVAHDSQNQPPDDDAQGTQDARPATPPAEEPTAELQTAASSEGHKEEEGDEKKPAREETALHRALRELESDDEKSPKLDKLEGEWKGMINVHSSEYPYQTPLHIALMQNFPKIAERLISLGADFTSEDCKDADEWYPIHYAARDGSKELLKLFLDPPETLNKQESNASWTPLNVAVYFEQENAVRILLEKGADLELPDSDGWTPLMTAVKGRSYDIFDCLLRKLEEESGQTKKEIINQADKEETTVLMALCVVKTDNAQRARISLDKLLKAIPDLDYSSKDCDGRTVLHHIMLSAKNYPNDKNIRAMAESVIKSVPEKALLLQNNEGKTALEDGSDSETGNDLSKKPLRGFLEQVIERLKGEEDDRETLLCWLVSRKDGESFAKSILVGPEPPRGLPRVLLECKVEEDDKKEAKNLIDSLRKELEKAEPTTGKDLSPQRQSRKGEAESSNITKQGGTKSQKFVKKPTETKLQLGILDKMEAILNYDTDYTNVKTIQRVRDPLKVSKLEDPLKGERRHLKAAIISIWQDNIKVSRHVQTQSVHGTVYDTFKSIKTFSDTMNEIQRSNPHNINASTQYWLPGTESNFTWIHLPATNMTWMIDTMNKILNPTQSDNLDDNKEDDHIAFFLRTSGVEIPDKSSPSRFMQPRYVKKHMWPEKTAATGSETKTGMGGKKGGENSASECMASALYVQNDNLDFSVSESNTIRYQMPFFELGFYRNPADRYEAGANVTTAAVNGARAATTAANAAASETKSRTTPPVHYSPTLDEHYYHFAKEDVASHEDRDLRNENQVVTKYLHPNGLDNLSKWQVIRVNQLWAWTIRDKWLITSTSFAELDTRVHVRIGSNAFFQHILERLFDRAETDSDSGPRTPIELSQFIVESCIGAYRKDREDISRHQGNIGKNSADSELENRSIRQIFSNSINKIGRQEAELFRNLAGLKSGPKNQKNSSKESKRKRANNTSLPSFETNTRKAARLLFEIRDVRDELNILRTIARYQQKVQVDLNGAVPRVPDAQTADWDEDGTAKNVQNDIEELDKLAKRTEEALNTTITIYESEIANLQATEAAEQGKRVMVFTLVTVFFLPLSFLSSLFALDVNSFLDAPWWSLVVIFVVPLPFLHAANGHVNDRDPFTLYLTSKKKGDDSARVEKGNDSAEMKKGDEPTETKQNLFHRLARKRGNKDTADASHV
ncbi:hypothetical protein CORC01_13780 [Colletotrichum orchidophilum]|uniref:Uncharacterized protein n=1 Tax=Colletotrichum orchidophilum TaxID=1209926 RepID=A0A1G4APA9_9PEZI|nr:uncharacterized protein CORC01_13780 [Colletotrichum orchidophilum]OHE90925.1 hypothetical protein CORC01_13780 [Colletotrichum orchidophilum]